VIHGTKPFDLIRKMAIHGHNPMASHEQLKTCYCPTVVLICSFNGSEMIWGYCRVH
jgi:hypothetical protein